MAGDPVPRGGVTPGRARRLWRRWRRRAPIAIGILGAIGLHYLTLTGPIGARLADEERARTIDWAGRSSPSREVVLVDLERWPRETFELEQALRNVGRATPSVVVLDVFTDADSNIARQVERDEQTLQANLPGAIQGLGCPVVLATTFDWSRWDGGSECPAEIVPPLPDRIAAIADFATPRPPEEAGPLLAIRQVWTSPGGDSRLGLALAAALAHRDRHRPGLETGSPEGIDRTRAELGATRGFDLDDGLIWLERAPERSDFVVVPLSDLRNPAPATLDSLRGKVVVFGLVGSISGLDWHLTPGGYRRGSLIHAALIEQILSGRHPRPIPERWAVAYSWSSLLLAGALAIRMSRTRSAVLAVLAVVLVQLLVAWSAFADGRFLLPSVRPAIGALLALAGVLLARAWVLQADLEKLRGAPVAGAEGPVNQLYRRVLVLRSVLNDLVSVRLWYDSQDPAFDAMAKDHLVFKTSDHLLARIAGVDLGEGTRRGLKEIVDILYQSLYEASGALKRIPEPMKTRDDGAIELLRLLRHYFFHAYDREKNESDRRRLDRRLVDLAGASLADLENAPARRYLDLQARLLEEIVRWLTALEEILRREIRAVHILAPRGYWIDPVPRFAWLWEGEAPGWELIVITTESGEERRTQLPGAARSFDPGPDLRLEPGEYSVDLRLHAPGRPSQIAAQTRFRIPEPRIRLTALLSPSHESSADTTGDRVEDLVAQLELAQGPIERARLLLAHTLWSQAAVELLDASADRDFDDLWPEIQTALSALRIPDESARSMLLKTCPTRGNDG